MKILTLAQLKAKGACADQRNEFKRRFGSQVEISVDLCLSVASVFDWTWAAHNFLSPPAGRAYEEATAPARRAYKEACARARRAYEEACAATWRAYEEACATTWRAYEEACARARRAYEEACARARRAYEEATASAFAHAYLSMEEAHAV